MRKLFILPIFLSFVYTASAQNLVKINECVIEGGVLKSIEADYNQANGERSIVVNGIRKDFYNLYPKKGRDYADGQVWYTNNDPVSFENKPYVKYGLPRVLGVNEISKAGMYKGVGVYTEAGFSGSPEVIYIPVRQGCEFQPYQLNCGDVRIEQVGSSGSSMQFTAKPSGLTGKISYAWEAEGATITRGQGTANIVVDVKSINDGDEFDLWVTATDAKKCPVKDFDAFVVKKPGTKPTQTSKWGAAERKVFMEECVKSSQLGDEAGTSYCSCMLEKIIKLHPDPVTVDKELKQEWIVATAKQCLPKK